MNADAHSTTVTITAASGPPRHATVDDEATLVDALTAPAYEPARSTVLHGPPRAATMG
jgi:hypothetical protein